MSSDAKSNPPKKSRIRNEIQQILDLKAQGYTNSQIQKHLGLRRQQFKKYYDKIKPQLVEDAMALCVASIARMQDLRQRFLTEYVALKKEGKSQSALVALRQAFEIDREIPKTCQLLGLIETPEQRVSVTVNDTRLETKSQEELVQEYESYKLQFWN